MAYKPSEEASLQIVKITEALSTNWDRGDGDGTSSDEDEDEDEDALFGHQQREEYPVESRTYPAIVDSVTNSSMLIKIRDTKIRINNVSKFTTDYTFQEGDRLSVEAKTQNDPSMCDRSGEICDVVSIEPLRFQERSATVTDVTSFGGLIGNEFVFFFSQLGEEYRDIKQLDKVTFVAIESDQTFKEREYTWRIAKISKVEVTAVPRILQPEASNSDSNGWRINHVVNFRFAELDEMEEKNFSVENLYKNSREITKLGIRENKTNRVSQLTIVKPKLENGEVIILEGKGQLDVVIRATAKVHGKNTEIFQVEIDGKLKEKLVEISVVDRLEENVTTSKYVARFRKPVLQQQADDNVVPGQRVMNPNRFIDCRIDKYPVPVALWNVMKNNNSYARIEEALKGAYPWMFETLNARNYRGKLHNLVYLEELAMNQAFRSYDLDRAHFNRGTGEDSAFLKLHVKNIAEKRPSITIGDSIKISDPFQDRRQEKTFYEGCIHKVKQDCILLQFNDSFQSKYNGEDYRIEFHFSRYSFRKQHHAIEQVYCKNSENYLGEQFFFPNAARKSYPQLDVELADDGNMQLVGYTRKYSWYNKRLNDQQKQAVLNILRGEYRPTPYVIFGPPGEFIL